MGHGGAKEDDAEGSEAEKKEDGRREEGRWKKRGREREKEERKCTPFLLLPLLPLLTFTLVVVRSLGDAPWPSAAAAKRRTRGAG